MNRQRAYGFVVRVLKYAVIAACFYYVIALLWNNYDRLATHEYRLRWLPLVVSFPLAIVYLLVRGYVWHLIVRRMVGRYPLRHDLTSWMSSLVGKYLPGKVFLLFGRIYLYRGHGASATHVGAAFLVEACCSTLAMLTVFGVAAVHQQTNSLIALWPAMMGVAGALIVMTHPAVLRFGINTARRLLRKPPIELQLAWRNVLVWTFLICLGWLVLGAGFYLLLWSLVDLPGSLYLYVTGAFAVAGVIGVLVLFAPSGIGVREGVMTFVLSQVMTSELAAAAAIVSRIWITLAEALCAGTAILMIRRANVEPLACAASSESCGTVKRPNAADTMSPPDSSRRADG
jgi:uncharacterized membrane protein YbhN (UPF0104 family)